MLRSKKWSDSSSGLKTQTLSQTFSVKVEKTFAVEIKGEKKAVTAFRTVLKKLSPEIRFSPETLEDLI